MPPFPLQAWVHKPEEPPTTSQKRRLQEIFYGRKEDDFSLPIGYTKFLQRVRQQQPDIPEDAVTYFYNRQTAVQIFFRFTKENQKRTDIKIPLLRSSTAFTELQLDLLSYTAPKISKSRQDIGRRNMNTKILVVVDPSSRFAFAGVYPPRENYENIWGRTTARLLISIIPENIQRKVKRLRMDAGTEFGKDFKETLRSESSFPSSLQIFQTNKAASLLEQNSPANMAPVETMIRTLREYMERYRRFSHAKAAFPSKESLQWILKAYNSEKHSAFRMQMSPSEATENPGRLDFHISNSNSKAYEIEPKNTKHQLDSMQPLQKGEIVRIMRRLDTMTKQSIPKVSYDLYRVQSIQGTLVTVWNLRKKQNRNLPVHITRVVRVKLNGDHSSDDPPQGTRYARFIDRVFQEQREEYTEDDYKIRVGIGRGDTETDEIKKIDVQTLNPEPSVRPVRERKPSRKRLENEELNPSKRRRT